MVAILTQPPPSAPKPLRGWVTTFHVIQSGQRRGPYHVRRWKQNGRLHKQYIKPADLETIKARCEAYRQEVRRQHQMLQEFRTFKGNWNYFFRILNRLLKRNVEPEHHVHMRELAKGDFFRPGRPLLRPRRRFMVPSVSIRRVKFTKRQWKELTYEFMLAFNAAKPPLTPQEKFKAQAADLKKHILANKRKRKIWPPSPMLRERG